MRSFVAIKVPAHPALDRCHDILGHMGGAVKAVPTGNMHLTLKFIGETSIPVPDLVSALESATAPHPPFVLRPTVGGAFPSWTRPNVVWIGFDDDGRARALARSVDEAMASHFSIGPETRPFSPHLTIARVKGMARTSELRSVASETASRLVSDGHTVPVDRVLLMSSTLTPRGPIYEEMGSAFLRG